MNITADIYFESTGEISDHKSEINSRDIDKINVIKAYDLVVRVGRIPTHRVWRDFEISNYKKLLNFSEVPLPGVSEGSVFKISEFKNFIEDLKNISMPSVLDSNLKMETKNDFVFEKSLNYSEEQKFFSTIKEVVSGLGLKKIVTKEKQKKSDQVLNPFQNPVFYIGNSLPIRHWDIDKSKKFNEVYANRGLNGIDGQLSSAIGLSLQSKEQKTLVVLGDLTTMYDLSAPWYWLKYKSQINLSLIVVNNGGGQIFSKMFKGESFLNRHQIEFKAWAEMWGLSYLKVTSSEDFKTKLESLNSWPDIIEYVDQ
jgi:2-succinyl-5-enolpyruvyl-6-hydroxy-3-cyclohexene-1-carboxylate synthase